MTSNTLTDFGISEAQIIRKDETFYLPISTLSQILICSDWAILKLLKSHKEDFEYSGNLKLEEFPTNDGFRRGYLLDEEQIYVLCMLMRRNEKAKEFRRVLAKVLKAIRRREFVHISELQATQKQLGEVTEKYICTKQKISKKRIERYHQLRALGLSQAESARAARIAFRSAVRLEKAKSLILSPSVKALSGGGL